ncbi:MAG: epoxyqueuosine reductase QueH [Lachnospiraceae bacterium]|nr:epoxyqueuosine reductase QueH [Lachnospiraceae bacterium]
MNKRNYQKELDKLISGLVKENQVPTLFLHSCCAPCSSYCLEYLSEYFEITVFYYNPNIFPSEEYEDRVGEQERLIAELNAGGVKHPIRLVKGEYHPEDFYAAAKGLEKEPEGGARCTECFKLRLTESAKLAKEGGYDYFTTTLTISPLKDAERLNRIGEEAGEKYGVRFLNSDFKKKNGYKRSTELSREHNLYRQNYCGCVYSKQSQP